MKFLKESLTFDDILLVPAYSEVTPNQVSLKTKLTKKIELNIPLVSAGMDTVTETKMAISMAMAGGIGIIHKNMSIELQAEKVGKVKAFDPKTATRTPDYSNAAYDSQGRLLCGAAVGVTGDMLERIQALVDAGVDVVTVDTAHGHSKNVINSVKMIKEHFPNLQIIAGNIATGKAATALIEAGADALKVGIGPGSICTTRVVAGIGVPQVSAIMDVYEVAKEYNVPIIADGGIKQSGDITKALASGGDTVMMGSLLAGTDEVPGETIELNGKKFKLYRGMGSITSMESGSADRYFQDNNRKLVPEGIEGAIPVKGPVSDVIFQLLGGLRSGMGYLGCPTIKNLQEDSYYVKITTASLIESHPHDVTIIKDAPNYKESI